MEKIYECNVGDELDGLKISDSETITRYSGGVCDFGRGVSFHLGNLDVSNSSSVETCCICIKLTDPDDELMNTIGTYIHKIYWSMIGTDTESLIRDLYMDQSDNEDYMTIHIPWISTDKGFPTDYIQGRTDITLNLYFSRTTTRTAYIDEAYLLVKYRP